MSTTRTHQNAVGSGGPAETSHQRTASISAPPARQPNDNNSSPQSPNEDQRQGRTNLPQHFIVRPSVTKYTASGTVTIPGPIVPLIAVDQLPEWLDLFGVPRELSVEQTVGLSNLGTVARDPEFYTVYMHGDFPSAPVMTNGRSYQDYRQEGRLSRTEMRQGRREDNDSALSIPSDVSTSGPPSTPSSTMSTSASPLSSRMDSTSKALPSSNQAYTDEPGKKAGGNGNNTNANNTKKPPSAPLSPINLGLRYRRIPSPTATGSTPPTNNNNPYPIVHPSYPQLHPPTYPSSHPHAPYPIPPVPPPSTMHPADRMLYSWNPPSTNARKSGANTSARQKSSANPSNPGTSNTSNPNNNGGTSNSAGGNSIYCKHWCHRGTCRWGAQCRYAHAMPATPEGLREVGLSHHPAWWTTAFNMAYGGGGFGGGWYPPTHPLHPSHSSHPHSHLSGKHYGGGGRKAQKEREREKGGEKEGGKGKERAREREKERGDVGKGKAVDGKANQPKKDVVEGKAGTAGGVQEQRKPEPPKEEPKLVEI